MRVISLLATLLPMSALIDYVNQISSDDGGGATPVPIPNTEVKSSSVEGTWRAAAWESRTLLVQKKRSSILGLDFFFLYSKKA